MSIRMIAVLFVISFCAVVVSAPAADPGELQSTTQARKHLETGRDLYYRGVRAEYTAMVVQAKKEFSVAIKTDPKCVDAHRGLQNCLKCLGEKEQSVATYKALYDADPKNPENIYLYARTLDSLQQKYDIMVAALPANKDSYWLHYGIAIAKYKAGNNRSCINSLEECIRIDPSRHEPYQLLINIYLIRGKNVDAGLEICERAIKQADAHGFAHATAASILQTKDKTKEALKHFEKAIEIEPDNIVYRVQIATMLVANGRKDEAKKHLRVAISSEVLRESIEEAAVLADDLFGIKWPISNIQSGDLRTVQHYLRQGEYANALSCVKDLLSENEKIAIFHVCKARALLGLKKCDEAAKSLDAAEKLEPKYVNIYEVRAEMMLAAGKKAQALALAQKAIELNPYSKAAYLILAKINHSEEKFAASVKNISTYYALTWDFEESRLFLIDEARVPVGQPVFSQKVYGFTIKHYLSSVPTGIYPYIRWIIHAEKKGKVVHTMFAEETRTLDKEARKMRTHYYLCDILDDNNKVSRIDMGEKMPTNEQWREAAAEHISEIYATGKDE